MKAKFPTILSTSLGLSLIVGALALSCLAGCSMGGSDNTQPSNTTSGTNNPTAPMQAQSGGMSDHSTNSGNAAGTLSTNGGTN